MSSRLILGTAQFNSDYGLVKGRDRVGIAQAQAMIDLANDAGFEYLDTAQAYLGAIELLPKLELHNLKIISKLFLAGKVDQLESYFVKLINVFGERCTDVLVHDPEKLSQSEICQLFDTFNSLKSKYDIKLGLSIYEPNMLKMYDSYFDNLNVVQAPCNVFDNRLAQSEYFNNLKCHGVKIHSRSVFLQGLLLMDINSLPKKLLKARRHILALRSFVEDNNLDLLQVCLWHAFQKGFDGTVVGVNSVGHLADIVSVAKDVPSLCFDYEIIDADETLIDPRAW